MKKLKQLLVTVPLALGASVGCVDDVAPLYAVNGARAQNADCTPGALLTGAEVNTTIALSYDAVFTLRNTLAVAEPQLVGGQEVTAGIIANTVTLTGATAEYYYLGQEGELTETLTPSGISFFGSVEPQAEVTLPVSMLNRSQIEALEENRQLVVRLRFRGRTGGGNDVESNPTDITISVVARGSNCSNPDRVGTCDPRGQNGNPCPSATPP